MKVIGVADAAHSTQLQAAQAVDRCSVPKRPCFKPHELPEAVLVPWPPPAARTHWSSSGPILNATVLTMTGPRKGRLVSGGKGGLTQQPDEARLWLTCLHDALCSATAAAPMIL